MNKMITIKKAIVAFSLIGFSFNSFGQLLAEGFEGATFPPVGWSTIDADGNLDDNWVMLDNNNGADPAITAIEGLQFAGSYSWLNVAFTPDNWLITPQLNVTDAATTLTFKGMGNYGSGDYMGVFISTTGTQQADFGTTAVFEQAFAAGDWEYIQISLAAYVGQNIYIAFRHFNCTDLFIMGLDDVKVSVPAQFDLSLDKVIMGSAGAWDYIPYTNIPVTQNAPIEFAGIVTNQGSATQSDIVVNVTSTGYVGISDPAALDFGQIDTLGVLTAFTPSTTIGPKVIDFNVSSGATDANMANNMLPSKTVNITSYEYGLDSGTPDSYVLKSTPTQPFEAGNVFNIFNTDTLFSALVHVNANSSEGAQIYTKIYELDPTLTGASAYSDYFTEIYVNQSKHTITASDLDNWVSLPLDEMQILEAGKSYALVVVTDGGVGANDFVCDKGGSSIDGHTCMFDTPTLSMFITSGVPMVRMSFETIAGASINENAKSTFSLCPNPSKGAITISSENLTNYQTAELVDQLGRTVGSWKIDNVTMTISTKNIAKGNYNLIVKGSNGSMIQKLMID